MLLNKDKKTEPMYPHLLYCTKWCRWLTIYAKYSNLTRNQDLIIRIVQLSRKQDCRIY